MNIKSKSYMENTEFKERQSRFEFFCVQAYEFIKQFRKDCREHWKNLFIKPIESQYQRSFEFSSPFNKNWARWTPERNRMLFS
jgi:hypothetical protein